MKKLFALMLVLTLVLSLAACGGGSGGEVAKDQLLVGTWKNEAGAQMVFKSNGEGTALMGDMPITCTWSYIEATNEFQIDYNTIVKLTIEENNGTYTLMYDGVEFTKVG